MLAASAIVAGHRGRAEIEHRLSYLTAYCAGWARGDVEMIRAAVSDDYLLDDPEEGRISKDRLTTVLPRLTERIDDLRDGGGPSPYLTLSHPVVDSSQLTTTVWCCFAVPGTSIQGMSQIRLGDDGVISDHRAYRPRPHVRVAGVRGRR